MSPQFPPAPTAEADVVVVGGTTAGLTCAALLAEAGRRVAVVEPATLAASASRATGMSSVVQGIGHELALRHSTEAAVAYLRELVAAHRFIREQCATAGLRVESPAGHGVAFDGHLAFELRQEARALRQSDIELEFVDDQPFATSVRPMLTATDQVRLDGAAYADALLRRAQAAGAQIYEESVPVHYAPGTVSLATARGAATLHAVDIIDTQATIPADGIIDVRLRWCPVVEAEPAAWAEGESHTGAVDGLFAFVDSPAQIIDAGPDRVRVIGEPVAAAQLRSARGALADWVGHYLGLAVRATSMLPVEVTADRAPVAGSLADGIWVVRGLGLWELGNATLAAREVVDGIVSGAEPLDRPRRGVGAIRRAILSRVGALSDPKQGIARVLAERGLARPVSQRGSQD